MKTINNITMVFVISSVILHLQKLTDISYCSCFCFVAFRGTFRKVPAENNMRLGVEIVLDYSQVEKLFVSLSEDKEKFWLWSRDCCDPSLQAHGMHRRRAGSLAGCPCESRLGAGRDQGKWAATFESNVRHLKWNNLSKKWKSRENHGRMFTRSLTLTLMLNGLLLDEGVRQIPKC